MKRSELVLKTIKDLHVNNIAIYAHKNFGKSYFLQELYKELQEQEKKVFFIDFTKIFSLKDFYEEFEKIAGEKIEHIQEFFTNFIKTTNTKIYILIDNFEEIQKIQSSALEVNYNFFTVFKQCKNIKFCLTIENSFGLDMFQKKQGQGFAEIVYLPTLSDAETQKIIFDILNEYDILLDEQLINDLKKVTNSIPYYLVNVSRLYGMVQSQNKQLPKNEILQKALNMLYANQKYVFELKLRDIRGKKHLSEILHCIVNKQNPYSATKTVAKKGNVRLYLSMLEGKNFIKQVESYGEFEIYDPFLQRYLEELQRR